jgi:uncharacterized repeat protein (TIGR01451 family)
MKSIFYFGVMLFCSFCLVSSVGAQCTSSAGTITPAQLALICSDQNATVQPNGDQILDANDVQQYFIYSNPGNPLNSVLALSSSPSIPFNSSTMTTNTLYYIAVVVGDNDGNGNVNLGDQCTVYSSANQITFLNLPNISGAITNVTCAGQNNGSITLTVSNGQQPYVYTWSDGQNNASALNLSPNTYTVTVTDNNGCKNTQEFDITLLNPILISGTVTPVACFGGNTGSIELDVTGGTPPYEYQWSNTNTTNALNNLTAGLYTITLTDANGCTAFQTFSVSQPPVIQVFAQPLPSCAGANGLIELTVQGGVSPFTYDWSDDGPEDPDNDSKNLIAPVGAYTVTVTDTKNCTLTASATILGSPAINISTSVTPDNCGSNSGFIDATVTGGTPPYVYLWSNGTTTQDINSLQGGVYCLTVEDAVGCSFTVCVTVETNCPVFGDRVWEDSNNDGIQDPGEPGIPGVLVRLYNDANNDSIPDGPAWLTTTTDANGNYLISGYPPANFILGFLKPANYGFSTSVLINYIQGNEAFTYPFTIPLGVTDLSKDAGLIPCQLSIENTEVNASCDQADGAIFVTVNGVYPPYNFAWSNNQTTPGLNSLFPGTYQVTVTDATGCTAADTSLILLNPGGNCASLEGRVFWDSTANCAENPLEPGLESWIVSASNGNAVFYATTDATGAYSLRVMPGFAYVITITPPNQLWAPCINNLNTGIVAPFEVSTGWVFPIQKPLECPNLQVSIAASLLRRCFSNNYYHVNYKNEGTVTALDAYIDVDLDAFMSFVGTSAPDFINLGNGIYRFPLGDLPPGVSGYFNIQVTVSCDAVLGQTHCTEAHIFPDTICYTPNILWSGASLRVESTCDPDSVRFTVKNIGNADMAEPIQYIVVEDGIMFMTAPLQLNAGLAVTTAFPANGSSWRMEIPQVPFHPGFSAPSAFVEGCTTNSSFSLGYINQYPVNDDDDWIDIDCLENVGSYDPNDKQGYPLGYGANHFIPVGADLEYMIRFQNTGTDTAFNIVIIDTLSHFLNPLTFKAGASSHPYRYELYGPGILKFSFENILLPDSFVNEPLSNGFVRFSIRAQDSLDIGAQILNKADIYFDFNAPIVTNETSHTIGEDYLIVKAWEPRESGVKVTISPNPMFETALCMVEGLESSTPLDLRLFNQQGQLVHQMQSASPIFQIRRGLLSSGFYYFTLQQSDVLLGTGKLEIIGH